MAKKITSEEVNKVLEAHWWFGKNSNQAAKNAGISQQTASGIIKAFQLMKNGDIEGLVREVSVNGNISAQTVRLVAERIGNDVPEEVLRAILERQQAKAQRLRNARAVQDSAPVEETPSAGPHPSAALTPSPCAGKAVEAPAEKSNDALYFIRILEELHELVQLQRDLLDVVIPKWAGDLKDNHNANIDVLAGLLKEQGQALDAIRCNTRKRGV